MTLSAADILPTMLALVKCSLMVSGQRISGRKITVLVLEDTIIGGAPPALDTDVVGCMM